MHRAAKQDSDAAISATKSLPGALDLAGAGIWPDADTNKHRQSWSEFAIVFERLRRASWALTSINASWRLSGNVWECLRVWHGNEDGMNEKLTT